MIFLKRHQIAALIQQLAIASGRQFAHMRKNHSAAPYMPTIGFSYRSYIYSHFTGKKPHEEHVAIVEILIVHIAYIKGRNP